jgi:hypothetical protein
MRAQRVGTEKADGLEGRVSHPPVTCDYAATPVLVPVTVSIDSFLTSVAPPALALALVLY